MIKINELRIGNYVAYADCGAFVPEIIGKPHKIAAEDFGLKYREDGVIKYYDPIPLTEDILLKSGFVERYRSDYTLKLEHDKFPAFEHTSAVKLENWNISYKGDILFTICSLHQLQNIFYCMTGQELKIEL